MLINGFHYHNASVIRRHVGTDPVELDIDYSAMSDEHLTNFKNLITWLINRHAKYIGVYEKNIEGYLMFLGDTNLLGKKVAKEILTRHLNLTNMDLEIQRREMERT
jgi:hypothetical protein